MNDYEVERSDDAVHYKKIATVKSKNNIGVTSYSVNDESPVPGTAFYRIKSVDNNGIVKYSKTISVYFRSEKTLQLYPNPWTPGTNLFVNNPSNEKLQVVFYDYSGKTVGTGFANGTTTIKNIILSGHKGILFYKITNSNDKLKGSGTILIID